MKQINMTLKGYLVTGILVWLPLAVTLWVLNLIVTTLDQSLTLLPAQWQPQVLLGWSFPGLGVLLSVLVMLLTGLIAANVLGRKVIDISHRLLSRTPVVKSIYNSVKQVSDTVLSGSGQAFNKAVLVEFPHQGAWTIAFQTGKPAAQVAKWLDDDYINVYVPTTPNPTSGYFIMVKVSDTRALDLSVDEALKHVISMGVVAPSVNSKSKSKSIKAA